MLQIFRRLFSKQHMVGCSKEHKIGDYTIVLPVYHSLDSYQKIYPRYDIALGEIAKIVFEKYQAGTAIDIGANVGDSAALISKYKKIPILCIEGNPQFIPFLVKNICRLDNKQIYLERSFVGFDDQFVDEKKIIAKQGTATIVGAIKSHDKINGQNAFCDDAFIPVRRLDAIINDYPQFLSTKLLKIDTDGYDFGIINGSLGTISELAPVLFFEYYLELSGDGDFESISIISKLIERQYKYFVIYDNFGNYMLSTSELEQFKDLNAYLKSNKKHKQIIYYFDVCAFHQQDEDLFRLLRQKELSVK